jgi:hypothetical protein
MMSRLCYNESVVPIIHDGLCYTGCTVTKQVSITVNQISISGSRLEGAVEDLHTSASHDQSAIGRGSPQSW